MRILHVVPYMHPAAGGPPVVVDHLAREQVAHGHEVRVATTNAYAPNGDTAWLDDLDDAYAIDVHRALGPKAFLWSGSLARALPALAADADVVHVHTVWNHPTGVAMDIARRQGRPVVLMPHGMLDPNSLARKWLQKRIWGSIIEYRRLRRCNAMIYTHDEERRLAEGSLAGLAPGYIAPLGTAEPPTTDRDTLAAEFLADHPTLAEHPRVLFYGRLHPKKGLDLLLPGFAQLHGRIPRARLLLVGASTPDYRRKLEQEAVTLGIADAVTFTGHLAGRAKWAALAAGDVFVLPSYQENFALAAAEAMRLRLPVVLSRRVNIWPEVTAAEAGLVCDLSPESVANSLEILLKDRARGHRMGENGHRLATERYTWSACAQAVATAYEAVLAPRVEPALA